MYTFATLISRLYDFLLPYRVLTQPESLALQAFDTIFLYEQRRQMKHIWSGMSSPGQSRNKRTHNSVAGVTVPKDGQET